MAELAQRAQTENATTDMGGIGASNNRFNQAKILGMNKYDAATLWLAPGAYKAGSILPFLPKSGLTVPSTRNGVAFRRNSLGLLELMAIDISRVHYVPGKADPVLLFEPSQINLFAHTEAFDNAYWTKVTGSVLANNGVGPDGNMTADKLVDATPNDGVLRRSATTTVAPYIQYIHAKAVERPSLVIFNSIAFATFDLLTGVVAETNANAVIQQINDYYLCALFFNGISGTPNFQYANAGTGIGASSGVNIWGAGLVQSRFLSSHISSGASSTTRPVDTLPIDDLQEAQVFNANEGCFLLDLERMVSNNAGDAVLTLRLANNTEVVRFIANGVANECLVNLPTLSGSSAYNAGKKIAVAWNGTNVRISQGGSIVATINGALGAVDQLRYTGTGLLEAYEMLAYNAAPTNSDLNALTA